MEFMLRETIGVHARAENVAQLEQYRGGKIKLQGYFVG